MSWGSNGGFKFTAGLDFDTKEHEVRPAIQLECQVRPPLRFFSTSPQQPQQPLSARRQQSNGGSSQTVWALLSPTQAVFHPHHT